MHPADVDVLVLIYRMTAATGAPPLSLAVAEATGSTVETILDVFRRLSARRLLALAPETGEIVMAPPFSAVPTPFLVLTRERQYFANCAWDALGIPAALHEDAEIRASCACCGEAIRLRVEASAPLPEPFHDGAASGPLSRRARYASPGPQAPAEPCVAHFAVPAARWWDDIVYT